MESMHKTQGSDGFELKDQFEGFTETNAPSPLSHAVQDRKLAPHTGTRHFVPREEEIENSLITIEKLLRRGSYNAAIREARKINLEDTSLAATYALMVNEKVARAQVALGDRYIAQGNVDKARASYQSAITGSNIETQAVAELTQTAITDVSKLREELFTQLQSNLIEDQYETWCETRRRIRDVSILDQVRSITPDISLEAILGPRRPPNWPPKDNLNEGWIDPIPIDDLVNERGLGPVLLDRPTLTPGSSFTTISSRPISLESINTFSVNTPTQLNDQPAGPLFASATFPFMSSMLVAHTRLFALEKALSPLGRSAGSMPVYRYEYLVKQARDILTFVSDVDTKMLSMQFALDDFAELTETIRRHIDENVAELQALNTRIAEIQTTLTTLTKGNEELGWVVQQLQLTEDDCNPEWWEYLISVLVVIGATAIGAGLGLLVGRSLPGAIAGGISSLVLSIGLTIQVWQDREITCDNVSQALGDFQSARSSLQSALQDVTAELNHSLLQRDTVIASLASLQDAYEEAITSNEVRVLNATTLSHILGVLDGVRRTTILRAHALARMAQDAYNAENDTQVNIVTASHSDYLDQDARGYTAAAVLQRDLDGLEHIRLTGRTRKHMQLTQSISLRKYYPGVFAAILTTGQGRFATRLTDFDRWFPGTYMQRLKEVRVEVYLDETPQPVRGYLSNDGVSLVRFADHGNHVPIDQRNVFAEPDEALRKLCYKRRHRHHAVETMAFPTFESFLFEARTTATQQQERNFFENCGLESTWQIELMPDQVLDHTRITDIHIHFQFEALFDPALKRVVEAKRYQNRNETALISLRKLFEEQGHPVDFTQPVVAAVTAFMFEAPHIDKTIRDVGLIVRPKQGPFLPGKARLQLNYQNHTPIEVETDDQGVVATANTKPAGSNTTALQNLTQAKSVAGLWSIHVLDLPQDMSIDDIDDILLMLRYTFQETTP